MTFEEWLESKITGTAGRLYGANDEFLIQATQNTIILHVLSEYRRRVVFTGLGGDSLKLSLFTEDDTISILREEEEK